MVISLLFITIFLFNLLFILFFPSDFSSKTLMIRFKFINNAFPNSNKYSLFIILILFLIKVLFLLSLLPKNFLNFELFFYFFFLFLIILPNFNFYYFQFFYLFHLLIKLMLFFILLKFPKN